MDQTLIYQKTSKTSARSQAKPIMIAEIFPQDLFDHDFQKVRPQLTTISKPIEDVYKFLTDSSNYSGFMKDINHCQITLQRTQELVIWSGTTTDHIKVIGAFAMCKAQAKRGTIVALKLKLEGSLEEIKNAMTKAMLKDSESKAYIILRRLKAFMETGEVPTTEGQPSGRSEDLITTH